KMIQAAAALVVTGTCAIGARTPAPVTGSISNVAWIEGTWVNVTDRRPWRNPGRRLPAARCSPSRERLLTARLRNRIPSYRRTRRRSGVHRAAGRAAADRGRDDEDRRAERNLRKSATRCPEDDQVRKRSEGTLVASIAGEREARPMSWVFTQRRIAVK